MKLITDNKTLLEWVYFWEKNAPHRTYLTQPMGGWGCQHFADKWYEEIKPIVWQA